jgi:hypothetical protein
VAIEEKNVFYWTDRAAKAGQKSLVTTFDEPNEPTQGMTLSNELVESLFNSVSKSGTSHHSSLSL